MLKEFLMQMRPFFGEEERQALFKYDFEEGFLTEFKETNEFEKSMAKLLRVGDTVAVNNGTIALSIAALSVGVEVGDEVIVPNFTMIATPNAIKLIGAKPVFCDVEKNTWCMCIDDLKEKITLRTKAVVLVSANGRYPSYDVDKLRNDLNSRGIQLIEDAAQAIACTYSDGEAIGTKGNVATLSFSAPKLISTGQGGLVFSRDECVSSKARKLKDFGRSSGGTDIHPEFGINSKFTEMQALVGLAQLSKLPTRVKRRKAQNKLYDELLKNIPTVSNIPTDYVNTTPWFKEILVERRDSLAQFLKEQNIGTRNVYPEINKQEFYSARDSLRNSKEISDNGLWLPSHMGVSDEHIQYICEQISLFFRK